MLDSNLAGAVRNGRVAAHWIGDESRFWYRRDGADGAEYVMIDAARATRSPLFDRARLMNALAQTSAASAVQKDGFEVESEEGGTRATKGLKKDGDGLSYTMTVDGAAVVKGRWTRAEKAPEAPAPTGALAEHALVKSMLGAWTLRGRMGGMGWTGTTS